MDEIGVQMQLKKNCHLPVLWLACGTRMLIHAQMRLKKWSFQQCCNGIFLTQCTYVAKNGHFYLYYNGLEVARAQWFVIWDTCTCAFAAENRYLFVLQWDQANECNWNSDTMLLFCLWHGRAVARANGWNWDSKYLCLCSLKWSFICVKIGLR